MGCGGFEEGSKRDRRRGDIGALWGEGYGGCREAHGTKKRGADAFREDISLARQSEQVPFALALRNVPRTVAFMVMGRMGGMG